MPLTSTSARDQRLVVELASSASDRAPPRRNARRDRAGTRPCAPTARSRAAGRPRWPRRPGDRAAERRRSRAGRDRRHEAPPDRVRGLDRNLLADDRAGERRERIAAPPQVDVRVGADQLPQHAVALAERARRFIPIGRLQRIAQLPRASPALPGVRQTVLRCGPPGSGARRSVMREARQSPEREGNGTLRRVSISGWQCQHSGGPRSGSPDSSPRPGSPSRPLRCRRPPRPRIRRRCCGSHSRRRKRASIRRASATSIRRRSTRRSSSGCSPTITSRGRRSSCRWWPRPCRKSPRTAGSTRTASARASTSRPIRRSRARSASSPRRTSSIRSCASLDPKNRSPYAFLIEGKIEGLDALAAKAKETGKFDYDAKMPGMEAVDRYTLRFRLVQNDYNFPYITAMVPSWVVAREVIEAYGDDTLAHPVGTGPYMLKSWTRGAKIVLEANPDYRGFVWDFQPIADPWDREARRGDEGQADAADRPGRDQHHRGGPVALAGVQPEGDRFPQPAGGVPVRGVRRRQRAQARMDGEGRVGLSRDRSRHLVLVPQLPRSADRRLFQGEDRAAPRDHHGLQPRRGDPRHPQAPGGRRRDADSRRASSATIPPTAASTATTPRSPTSCSTTSTTRAARTATGRCPTASR